MTWFRIDDGLPEHPKSDALEAAAGGWQVYAVACMTWRDMGCDCAHQLTDGEFLRSRAHRKVRAPAKIVDRALAALVTAGFLSVDGDTFRFHNWSRYNPSRDEVMAKRGELSVKRAEAGRRGGLRSGEARSMRQSSEPEASGKQTGSKTEANTKPRSRSPSPSRTPEREPGPPTPASGVGSAGSSGSLPGVVGTPRPTIEAALEAIASESGGRFVVPRGAAFDPKLIRPLQSLLDGFSDLASWRRVGRWLASWSRTDATVSAAWLAKNRDAFAKAEAWESTVNDPARSGVLSLSSGDPALDELEAKRAEWQRKYDEQQAARAAKIARAS